jgi:hypothetical protein
MNDATQHIRRALEHLQAALVAAGDDEDAPEAPEWRDAAVARQPAYRAAQARFGASIRALAARATDNASKQLVLDAESAANALGAAGIDAAWRLGRQRRRRATR